MFRIKIDISASAVIISLVALVIYSLYIFPWMLDDAFISFRYAENIAAGNGPVYNVGEKVEGYTSFLWVILLALGKSLGANIVILSRVLGIIFAIGCMLLILSSHKFIRGLDKRVSACGLLIMGTSGVFLPWGISGMETTLFAFLILLTILLYTYMIDRADSKKILLLGLLCGLTTLTRPEGILIFAMIIIHKLLRRDGRKLSFYLLIIFLALYVPYFIWRYAYYGFLFPNTFYDKVGLNYKQVFRGIRYLAKFVVPSLMILLPLIDPDMIRKWLKGYRNLAVLPLIIIVYTVYIIAVGGDSMPASRFFMPIMPLICLLSAMSVFLIRRKKRVWIWITAIMIYNVAMLNFFYITPYIKFDRVAELGKEVGLWLKGNVSSDAVLATNTAGSIPYYSGLRTIDMLGLNDIHIAHRRMPGFGKGWAGHEKTDAEYILDRKPNLIQLGSSLGEDKPAFVSDFEIYGNPEFQSDYVLRRIILPSGRDLKLFESRDHQVLDNARRNVIIGRPN